MNIIKYNRHALLPQRQWGGNRCFQHCENVTIIIQPPVTRMSEEWDTSREVHCPEPILTTVMSNTHTVLLVLVKGGLNDCSFEKVCYGIRQSSDSAKIHSDISTTIFTILAHSLSRGYVKRNLEKQAKDMNTFWNRLKMPPTLGHTGSVDSEIQKPTSQTRKISGARQETQGAKERNLPVVGPVQSGWEALLDGVALQVPAHP